MKTFVLGLLVGIGVFVFILWRLDEKLNRKSDGCLLPSILGMIIFLIGAVAGA